MNPLSILDVARDPALAARPALITKGQTLSYAELASRALSLSRALAHEGVNPSDRVALLAKNSVETVTAVHALLALGATIVPVHPRLTPAEAEIVIADAAPRLVLREDEIAARLEAGAAMAQAEGRAGDTKATDAEAPLAMVYTSGTTGKSKGALLSRRAFLASARGSEHNLPLSPRDAREGDAAAWLLCMPICHVGGLSILTRSLLAASAVLLEARFDPDAILASIARHRPRYLSVVPTMLRALLERDGRGDLALLSAVLVGGAATPPSLLDACAERGVPAITTYGLTEACSQVTVQRLEKPYRPKPGSGTPLPGVELRIHEGRIHVRGPTLMSGYFRGEGQALDRPFDAEGFFDTGDLGELDAEGRLHVHARRTDLIVTGGENVYPIEIEHALEALPGVRRALVFGVPDDRWGHIVAAAIELDEGARVEPLADMLAARLAPHKRPRRVAVVHELPLNNTGKLERKGAIERFASKLLPFGSTR